MKRLLKFIPIVIFIIMSSSSSMVYGFDLGGGHGGDYDTNAYWPAQSNMIRLSSYGGIQEPFLKFTFTPTSSIVTPPVVGRDGEIYFCTMDEKLYAVNPDGTEKWSVPCGYVRDGAPVIGADGTIYVASDAGVMAFDRSGTTKWTYEQGTGYGSLEMFPTLDIDGNVLITQINAGGGGGTVYDNYRITCINKENGTFKWDYVKSVEQHDGVDLTNKASCAVGSDGTIYVKLGDKFVALNRYGGEKWVSTGGLFRKYYSKIAIDGTGNIYLTSYHPQYTGEIFCYTADGARKWTAFAENVDIQDQCAVGPNGTIYAVTGWRSIDYGTGEVSYREGGLFTIDPITGNATEIYHDANGIFNSPTIASDGMIYLDDGTALNSSGTKLWKVNGFGKPAIGKDGTIYYRRTVNGRIILCAYKDRQPGSLEWHTPYYSVDESSGTVTLYVTRNNGADGSVSVDYETIDSTAKAGIDYTSTSGTLIFGDGEAQKTVTIPINNDRIYTENRSFSVQLKNISGGGSLGSDIYAGVSILEDDAQDYDPPIIESITPLDNQENV